MITVEQKIKENKKLIKKTNNDIKSGNLSNGKKWYAQSLIDYAKLEIQRLEL